MPYSLLADMTMLVHLLFVLFVVFGGVAVLRRPRLAWLHLPAAIWGAAIELGGWVCPLTYLENHFRRLGGESGYGGTFVGHYLGPVIYPHGLTRHAQVMLGLAALFVNLAIYIHIFRKRNLASRLLKK